MEYGRFKAVAKKAKSAVRKALFIAAFGITAAGCTVYDVRHAKPYIPLSTSDRDVAYMEKDLEAKACSKEGVCSPETYSGRGTHIIGGRAYEGDELNIGLNGIIGIAPLYSSSVDTPFTLGSFALGLSLDFDTPSFYISMSAISDIVNAFIDEGSGEYPATAPEQGRKKSVTLTTGRGLVDMAFWQPLYSSTGDHLQIRIFEGVGVRGGKYLAGATAMLGLKYSGNMSYENVSCDTKEYRTEYRGPGYVIYEICNNPKITTSSFSFLITVGGYGSADFVYTPLREHVNNGEWAMFEAGGYFGLTLWLFDIFARVGKAFNPDGIAMSMGIGLNSNGFNYNCVIDSSVPLRGK